MGDMIYWSINVIFIYINFSNLLYLLISYLYVFVSHLIWCISTINADWIILSIKKEYKEIDVDVALLILISHFIMAVIFCILAGGDATIGIIPGGPPKATGTSSPTNSAPKAVGRGPIGYGPLHRPPICNRPFYSGCIIPPKRRCSYYNRCRPPLPPK